MSTDDDDAAGIMHLSLSQSIDCSRFPGSMQLSMR